MKILKLTKTGIAAIITGVVMFAFTSCEPQPDDSKEVAEEQNEETFDTRQTEKDADYLVDAAAILQKNTKLGELAATKATTPEVKDLGSDMAKTHGDDLAELQALATSKAITLPGATTENTMDAYEDLNDKTGLDFDKKYCDKVISSHKDAINKMETIEQKAEDADIRAWATKMLPHLRSHLTTAEGIQNTVKDMK